MYRQSLYSAPSTKQLQKHHDHRDDQQQMNEAANRRAGNKAQAPQKEKNNCDGEEHGQSFPFVLVTRLFGTDVTNKDARHGAMHLFVAVRSARLASAQTLNRAALTIAVYLITSKNGDPQ